MKNVWEDVDEPVRRARGETARLNGQTYTVAYVGTRARIDRPGRRVLDLVTGTLGVMVGDETKRIIHGQT